MFVICCSDTNEYGCDGGTVTKAYYWVYVNGGLELDSSYPYTSYYGTVETCAQDTELDEVHLCVCVCMCEYVCVHLFDGASCVDSFVERCWGPRSQ